MNCPKCDFELIKEQEASYCLVRHDDGRSTIDGKEHDHAVPCDYGGGIQFRCRNGHMVAVPTINKCWCGKEFKGKDGGFDKEYERHETITLPWKESADYYGRRRP